MSPILAQNHTTDSSSVNSLRNNVVFKHIFHVLKTIRDSSSLTVTFWGAVMTLIAFIVNDGVWAGIVGVWGLSLTAFGACWYVIAIRHMAPDKSYDSEESDTAEVDDRIDWTRVTLTLGASIAVALYAAYTTTALGVELFVFPLAFIAVAAYLYTKPSSLEVVGNGLYLFGLLLFVTPIVFYFSGVPQSAQNAGIQIDHMVALGSLLFVFSLVAVLVSLGGYFINNRAQKKSDQQRFKSRMGSN